MHEAPNRTHAPAASMSPLDRDPRTHPFGMLLVDNRMYDGVDGFAWFKDEFDAITYLTTDVWREIGISEEESCEARDLYRQVLWGKEQLTEEMLLQVRPEQEKFLVIWFGYFAQIRENPDPYTQAILESFANNPREVNPAKAIPTGDNELDELFRVLQMARALTNPRERGFRSSDIPVSISKKPHPGNS